MSWQRQQEQNEEMRAKILEIARRILKEEGAEAVSVRRITKEIDYSSGIVYHYFSGKEEILHPPAGGLPADPLLHSPARRGTAAPGRNPTGHPALH